VAATHNVAFEERPFSVKEALAAREAFLTSATNGVMPIVKIDGKTIGRGKHLGRPGPVATALRAGLIAAQMAEAGAAKV
jgi:D-alanine transaminase